MLSSLHVALVVLHPRLPINPCLVRFRTALPHPLARLILANSITLTPGTVTLDVQDNEFLVHALTQTSARGLDPKSGQMTMQQRVVALYPAAQSSRTPGATV